MNDRRLNEILGPVFVVGMNGSGTTMMLDHLGRHPGLFAFQLETYVLPHFLQTERKYGDLSRDENFSRLWRDMGLAYAFRRRNAGAPVSMPADWMDTARSAAGVFDRIMLEFARREGKARWSEKTPMYVLHIEKIAASFPGSRFIHMLRDGRDCAASDHRRWGRHPDATMYRWKHAVSEGQRQGASIGDRYLELRYEDVTQEPERYLRAACEFLRLEFDEDVLSKDPRARRPEQKSATIVANRRAAYFDDRRTRRLERIAGRRLAELGYEPRFCEGDENPSPIVRAWWLVHDTYRIFVRQVKMKMTVQSRMTWPLFFARLKAILRSSRGIRRGGR